MGWQRKPSHSPTWSRASRPKVTNRRFAAASGRAKAMTHKVFIDGAAGTTGLEIAERLAGRSEFALVTLPDAERKSAARRAEALNDADFVILCLPDEAAREAVAMIDNDRTRVIDASTAHRVAPGWVYGFPEVSGHDAVAGAARVSNPGCYSTGFIALVAPLVRAGLLPADWVYVCRSEEHTSELQSLMRI